MSSEESAQAKKETTIYTRKMDSEISGDGAIGSGSLQSDNDGRLTDKESRVKFELERDGNTELIENNQIKNNNNVNAIVNANEVQDEDDLDTLDPDQADKFKLKKMLTCMVGKHKPIDEDRLPYGFSETVNEETEEENVASVGNASRKRNIKVERKNSLKQSLKDPILPSDFNKSAVSLEQSQRRVPDPYPCQTNIQRHVCPKSSQSKPFIEDDDTYNFSHSERGHAVMIVNDRFRRQTNRDGAHWDLLKTKEICRKLGFRLFNYGKERNLSKAETLMMLRRAQQTDHSNCDSFLFMISTHGLEQPNVRAKGKLDHALVCADDQLIFTSSILDMFNEENCPSLRGKPKLFFIQACRGENLDHGSDVFVVINKGSYDVTDITRLPSFRQEEACGGQESSTRVVRKKSSVDEADTKPGPGNWSLDPPKAVFHSTSTPQFCTPRLSHAGREFPHVPSAPTMHINKIYAPTPFAIVDTPSLRCDNDMLVMYAIPEGMFAWRNTSDGSWMIDYLHQVIMAYDMTKPKNFLSLLTKVSAIMSRRSTNAPSSKEMDQKKAIPVIEHKLTRDVIFQQKVPMSGWIK